jgi:hypothetical protein
MFNMFAWRNKQHKRDGSYRNKILQAGTIGTSKVLSHNLDWNEAGFHPHLLWFEFILTCPLEKPTFLLLRGLTYPLSSPYGPCVQLGCQKDVKLSPFIRSQWILRERSLWKKLTVISCKPLRSGQLVGWTAKSNPLEVCTTLILQTSKQKEKKRSCSLWVIKTHWLFYC